MFVFQKNINLRDSFGVIGGIITFIISLIIFDGIKNFQEFSTVLINFYENGFLSKIAMKFLKLSILGFLLNKLFLSYLALFQLSFLQLSIFFRNFEAK